MISYTYAQLRPSSLYEDKAKIPIGVTFALPLLKDQMPFDLRFNARQYFSGRPSVPDAEPVTMEHRHADAADLIELHETQSEAQTETISPRREVQETPSFPKGRPALSLSEILARDATEKQWYKLLTHKQRLFVCALFANGFDVSAAAQEAAPYLAPNEARSKGKYWYKLPKVRTAIELIHTYYQETTKVRWEDIIAELRTIAYANIMDFYEIDKYGHPVLAMDQANPDLHPAISEIHIEQTRFGPKSRIKMHDKMAAVDRLLKLLQPGAAGAEGGGSTNITVQNINIVPVPQGQFLPAPKYDDSPVIDAKPIPSKPLLQVV